MIIIFFLFILFTITQAQITLSRIDGTTEIISFNTTEYIIEPTKYSTFQIDTCQLQNFSNFKFQCDENYKNLYYTKFIVYPRQLDRCESLSCGILTFYINSPSGTCSFLPSDWKTETKYNVSFYNVNSTAIDVTKCNFSIVLSDSNYLLFLQAVSIVFIILYFFIFFITFVRLNCILTIFILVIGFFGWWACLIINNLMNDSNSIFILLVFYMIWALCLLWVISYFYEKVKDSEGHVNETQNEIVEIKPIEYNVVIPIDNDETNEPVCIICLEIYLQDDDHYPCTLPCGHSIGYSCFEKYKQKTSLLACPSCRYGLDDKFILKKSIDMVNFIRLSRTGKPFL